MYNISKRFLPIFTRDNSMFADKTTKGPIINDIVSRGRTGAQKTCNAWTVKIGDGIKVQIITGHVTFHSCYNSGPLLPGSTTFSNFDGLLQSSELMNFRGGPPYLYYEVRCVFVCVWTL